MPAEVNLGNDFRDLLTCFVDEGVEFLLIGGWALALHGHGRSTDDMDVLVRPSPENAERVYQALLAFGAPLDAHDVTPGLFAQPGSAYRLGVKPALIEVLTKIDGLSFDEAVEGARTFEVDGRRVPFIARQALLKNKRAAGRPKDLADVAWLEAHPETNSER
ncbi:hypothetical protein [Chondromyces apiculatus]|uniref:hypothetical protein n=1 Tax=Chondromyces apiculatus TaxID=51 RepID=UPI00069370A1|nr:hypothetical protein [Chondromyces apiculatus]